MVANLGSLLGFSGLTKMSVAVELPHAEQTLIERWDSYAVLYNPNQITVSQSLSGGDDGEFFGKDNPKTLSVDLFFDTTLKEEESLFEQLTPAILQTFTPKNVLAEMAWLDELTRLDGGPNKNRPRRCKISWGEGIYFEGVLTSLTKTYSHFWSDGRPVRATASCSFQEYLPEEIKQKGRNPVDDPIRIVKRGETLSSIAAREFGDPALWRVIAAANGINRPRSLYPGQVLTIPPRPSL